MQRDPVCQMDVDEPTAAGQSTYHGRTFYFCSPGCKEASRNQLVRRPKHPLSAGRRVVCRKGPNDHDLWAFCPNRRPDGLLHLGERFRSDCRMRKDAATGSSSDKDKYLQIADGQELIDQLRAGLLRLQGAGP